MKSSSLTQAMVVCRKELVDWSRDRRSIITLLVSSLLAPVMIGFMFNSLASRQRQVEDVTVPVVGAAHAPALVEWLRQQPGITIVDGPADAEEAVRTRREDVIVVIPENFAKQFAASKPAQVRLVADSSSQNARPKVQRVRALFQRYSSEIGSLRLIARGVSPVVAAPVQVEDVEVSSAQQRAAMILGFIPLFVMITAFTGAMQIATDSTAGERERGSIEALLVNPAPRGAIAAGKWIAGTATALLAVLFTGGLLFALFQYIPLQDLGLRFQLGVPQLAGTLAAVLPLVPLIVALQMYVATFAKSFKEAQSYLSFLMMAQMVPGMMATMNTMTTKAWMYYIPWLGQQSLMTDVLGNKPIHPAVFVVVAITNIALAIVMVRLTSGLLMREKIIFGR
ncbi:MAG: ABC transporter permease [Acidobacteriota bacterium]|nr:ABC transporter permease [Acidobacteriota bacterium]MDP3718962.1 ABC transporter permease [Acidobacteriota bacterium]